MAIGATCVWEVRTAGAQANGGGYTSGGTDYSQQDAAQLSLTDLVSATPYTTITSVTGGFTAAMIGNMIQITSGTNFTPGWYEIKTRVDTNTITVDRACATGAALSGVGAVGGAFKIGGTLDNDFFSAVVAGNKIWIGKGTGTYTLGEAVSTAITNLVIEGYNATRADAPTGANRPTIAAGANTFYFTGNYNLLKNFIVTTSSQYGFMIQGYSTVINIKSTNSSASADYSAFNAQASYNKFIFCEGISTNGDAIKIDGANANHIYGSYFHDSKRGVNFNDSQASSITNSIADTCSSYGIGANGFGLSIIGNTLYGAETPAGSGIYMTGSYENITVLNNIIYGWTTGINYNALFPENVEDWNNLYNNTTPRTNVNTGANSIAADPSFVDAPNGDFRVGASMKAKGNPGTFANMGAGATCIGYLDLGAVQRIEPTAAIGRSAWAR